jgi:hypothetical protein
MYKIILFILLFLLILWIFKSNIEPFSTTYDFTADDGSKATITDDSVVVIDSIGKRTVYNKYAESSTNYGDNYTYMDSLKNIAVLTVPKYGLTTFYTQNSEGTNRVNFSQVIGFQGIYTFTSSTGMNAVVTASKVIITDTKNINTEYTNYLSENKDNKYVFYYKSINGNKAVFMLTDKIFYTEDAAGKNKLTYVESTSFSNDDIPLDEEIKTFYGPNGEIAKLTSTTLIITTSDGWTQTFTTN